MNIWAIGKNGKPLTGRQIRKIIPTIMFGDNEVLCATSRKTVAGWIRCWHLTDCEPVKIWSGK